jgi:hypothetical protein
VDSKSRPWLIAAAVVLGFIALFGMAARVLYDRTEQRVVEQHTRDHQLLTQFAAVALTHRAESYLHAAEVLAARLEAAPAGDWSRKLAASRLPAQSRAFLLRADGAIDPLDGPRSTVALATAVEPWRETAQPVLTNPFVDDGAAEQQVALLVPLRQGNRVVAHLGLTLSMATLLGEPLQLNGGAEQPNLALLDEHGTVLVNTRHPEMLGRQVPAPGQACQPCHSDFTLERRMIAGETGAGRLQVAQEPLALVTFAPARWRGGSGRCRWRSPTRPLWPKRIADFAALFSCWRSACWSGWGRRAPSSSCARGSSRPKNGRRWRSRGRLWKAGCGRASSWHRWDGWRRRLPTRSTHRWRRWD